MIRCYAILLLCALPAWGQANKPSSTEPPQSIRSLEKALETNPEDVRARERLLTYYSGRSDDTSRQAKLRHIEWLIENHPDSPLLYRDSAVFKGADFRPPYEGDLRALIATWQQQVEANTSNVRILENAVKGLSQVNYPLTADCLKRLRQIEPTNPQWAVLLASLYGGAVTASENADKALKDLQESTDLPVIGLAGQGFYGLGKRAHSEQIAQLGESLLKKAQSLDPLNPRWSTAAAEKPTLLTERDMWPYGKIPEIAVPKDAVRLAPESEAARLIHKVAPECTPGPNVACPQKPATVKLMVRIGNDGLVEYVHAMSGDMSTIPAAMDAARNWTFHPAIVDGEAVEVVTEIELAYAGPKAMPVAKGSGFTPPEAISKAEAEYTPEASAAKFQGSVMISLVVDEQGVPRNIKVVRGVGLGLDQKAMDAVAKWKFRPAMKDGKPIAVPANVEVQFKAR